MVGDSKFLLNDGEEGLVDDHEDSLPEVGFFLRRPEPANPEYLVSRVSASCCLEIFESAEVLLWIDQALRQQPLADYETDIEKSRRTQSRDGRMLLAVHCENSNIGFIWHGIRYCFQYFPDRTCACWYHQDVATPEGQLYLKLALVMETGKLLFMVYSGF
jgi:hypothetical protein